MQNLKISKKIHILPIMLILLFSIFYSANAQNASELKSKIEDHNAEIKKLEQEIASYKTQLTALDNQANTLSGSIKKLDLTKQKLLADIKLTENKISATNFTINNLSSDIGNKEAKINQDKSVIAKGVIDIDQYEAKSLIHILLSKDNLSDVWNEVESIKDLQASLKDQISELKSIKSDLEDNKNDAEKAKNHLVSLKDELGDQKKINDQNTAEKNRLLKETKNKESNYKKILQDKIARKEAFEKELRSFESQLKFILDPSSLPKTGTGLSWPLDDIFITQLFGSTIDSKRLYTSGSHNGVDFKASIGTPIKAMAGGTIMGTGDTDLTCPGASYGRWVLIKHDNGLSSIYAHLSLIKVSQGQTISAGQVIGYSGSTGYSTGPHLHIGVYAASAVKIANLPSKSCGGRTYTMPVAATNAYLDPMLYLPKT